MITTENVFSRQTQKKDTRRISSQAPYTIIYIYTQKLKCCNATTVFRWSPKKTGISIWRVHKEPTIQIQFIVAKSKSFLISAHAMRPAKRVSSSLISHLVTAHISRAHVQTTPQWLCADWIHEELLVVFVFVTQFSKFKRRAKRALITLNVSSPWHLVI